MAQPLPTSTRAPGGWLGFWVGVLVTVGLVAALVQLWPEDDPRPLGSSAPATPTTRFGVPELPEGFPDITALTVPGVDVDLFTSGLPEAVNDALARAGSPAQLLELAIYPTYLVVTPEGAPGGAPEGLFSVGELDLARIPSLVDDAPSHYGVPVTVTHVLINRFLPFDQRVLVRVYASPPGDPAGGGYVSYTTDGTLVAVCC